MAFTWLFLVVLWVVSVALVWIKIERSRKSIEQKLYGEFRSLNSGLINDIAQIRENIRNIDSSVRNVLLSLAVRKTEDSKKEQ